MATAAVSIQTDTELTVDGLSPPGHDGVTFTFEGSDYTIEPKALSSKVIRALVAKYDQMLRGRLISILEALRSCKDEEEKKLVKEMYDYHAGRMEKVMFMLQSEEGMAIALHLCSPEVETLEEAQNIVEEYPAFTELIRLVFETTTLNAAAGN